MGGFWLNPFPIETKSIGHRGTVCIYYYHSGSSWIPSLACG